MMTADRMSQEISPMETRKAAGIIKPLCSFKVNLFQLLRRAKLSSPDTSSLIDLERRENKNQERSWALDLGLVITNTNAGESDDLVFIICIT